jgi:hypothetical protein
MKVSCCCERAETCSVNGGNKKFMQNFQKHLMGESDLEDGVGIDGGIYCEDVAQEGVHLWWQQ